MITQKTRRITKWGMAAITLLMLAGGTASAQTSAPDAREREQTTAEPAVKKSVVASRHLGADGWLANPVHAREYWKLLVAAYAPDLSPAWKQALEERKQVEATFPKPETSNIVYKSLPDGEPGKNIVMIKPAEPGAEIDGADAVSVTMEGPEGDAPGKRFTVRLLDKHTEGAPLKIKLRKEEAEAGEPAAAAKAPETVQRQMKLSEAVEKGDADAIRSLLPQLLDDYREQTGKLKTSIEKLKALQSEATGGSAQND